MSITTHDCDWDEIEYERRRDAESARQVTTSASELHATRVAPPDSGSNRAIRTHLETTELTPNR